MYVNCHDQTEELLKVAGSQPCVLNSGDISDTEHRIEMVTADQ